MLNKKIGFGLVLMVLMVGSSIAAVSAIPRDWDPSARGNLIIAEYTNRVSEVHTQFADLRFYEGDSLVKEYSDLNLTDRGGSRGWCVYFGETPDDVTGEIITPPEGTTSYEVYIHDINLASGKIPIAEKTQVDFENSKLDRNPNTKANGDYILVKPRIPSVSALVPWAVPVTAESFLFK
ncbi:MAG: hypothetical protein LBT10_03535 [Methanobrevibacter sp.]|jgi:hypothetical protein|nr:hypothetical protein [Methanobrevibacter sp.]